MDFFARRALYKAGLLRFLAEQSDLYLLTGIPGNIGDHLIWAGTEDLFASGQISYTSIPLSNIEDTHLPQSTLLVPGSGALTKSYHEWLPATVIKASHRFRKVILLPSSYDLTVPIVAECLSRQNVFAFAREAASYRSIKIFGRAALSFDCAVYFNRFDDIPAGAAESAKDGRLLLALRGDMSNLFLSDGFVPCPVVNQDISLKKANLNEWISSIFQVSTVVTDRLHVAIASIFFGKRVFYLDPYGLKISDVFSFTFREAFNDRVHRCSVEWLLANAFVQRAAS